MTASEVIARRLAGQRLSTTSFTRAAEVVSWLGAVQSQDYAGATWAVSMRATSLTSAGVNTAFDAGDILRTHLLRPTWHFVVPTDIRWIVALTGARIRRAMASYFPKFGLSAAVCGKSRRLLERILRNHQHLTRAEIAAAHRRAGIVVEGIGMGMLMMHAETDALICSGPRRGKQFTYALMDERVPAQPAVDRDESLAELARRYFTSHGPATLSDFAWWSGLTRPDARRSIEILGHSVESAAIGGLTCWWIPSRTPSGPKPPHVRLLPNYDEYLIAHKDRGFVLTAPAAAASLPNASFSHCLVVDGRIAGMWRRTIRARHVAIEVNLRRRLTGRERAALEHEAERYGQCFSLIPHLTLSI